MAECVNPEAEATLAAHEILRHVRGGGRFRDVAVVVRSFEGYHAPLQRIFLRYGIPFFMDRREPVSHHPLAELTRSALRTVAFQWAGDDWFAALKTGLAPASERELDELENEALARGWKGTQWHEPIRFKGEPRSAGEQEALQQLQERLERVRQRIIPAFQRLSVRLTAGASRPTGPELAAAVREFWTALNVEQQLEDWAGAQEAGSEARVAGSVHRTVWEQMQAWLENIELGFAGETLPLREWLPILEAGLANLTVGIIPPALDQVSIGAIDRSRNPNPDIKLAIVLGLNEAVFPALPEAPALLTELDRTELEKRNVALGATAREQIARERYLGYVACTRASERLVLTRALHDADGGPLNPSAFLSHVRQLFPALEVERVPRRLDWRQSEHASELIVPLLRVRSAECRVSSEEGVGRGTQGAPDGAGRDALAERAGGGGNSGAGAAVAGAEFGGGARARVGRAALRPGLAHFGEPDGTIRGLPLQVFRPFRSAGGGAKVVRAG